MAPGPAPDSDAHALAEHHHRDIQGGTARAAVFGVSDGLVSNVAIVLGFAGANTAPGLIRLAGLTGLIGGAVSMAAGEYVSMKAQSELLERELDLERIELHRRPEAERRELAAIYRSRGVDEATADQLATALSRDPEMALETHAREELGIDPSSLGKPVSAAVSSFFCFGIGASIPLTPYLVGTGTAALVVAILLGALAGLAVGAALARFTGRSMVRSSLRQLLFTAVPAVITFALGAAVGVSGI
ncbi:MAG: VIT1/CCC1 transporter family protein [Actinomycetota bacterium]|nr:VIT1/CCC1 transporter family protein [Actinomycetota bacterium]